MRYTWRISGISSCIIGFILIASNVMAIKESGYLVESPNFSPDGQSIIFSSDALSNNSQIFTINTNGSNLICRLNIPGINCLYPAWSPNGNSIAYSRNLIGSDISESIWMMNANGSNSHRISSIASDNTEPTWTSDGSHLVISTCRDIGYDLILTDKMGKESRYIAASSNGEASPDCSPDGNWVVYEAIDNDLNSSIWKRPIGNILAAPTRLTSGAFRDSHPRFSPDGQKIVFQSNRDTSGSGIWMMNVNGSNLHELTGFSNGSDPDWSLNGTKIVFVGSTEGKGYQCLDIYTINVDGTGLTKITDLGTPEPTFTPNGGPCSSPVTISISCNTPGATIRYTTDGTDPVETSSIYTSPINVNQDITIKAKAWSSNRHPSTIREDSYKF